MAQLGQLHTLQLSALLVLCSPGFLPLLERLLVVPIQSIKRGVERRRQLERIVSVRLGPTHLGHVLTDVIP